MEEKSFVVWQAGITMLVGILEQQKYYVVSENKKYKIFLADKWVFLKGQTWKKCIYWRDVLIYFLLRH